jgi:hypothetical protein
MCLFLPLTHSFTHKNQTGQGKAGAGRTPGRSLPVGQAGAHSHPLESGSLGVPAIVVSRSSWRSSSASLLGRASRPPLLVALPCPSSGECHACVEALRAWLVEPRLNPVSCHRLAYCYARPCLESTSRKADARRAFTHPVAIYVMLRTG